MQVTIESYNSVYLNVDFYSETDASKFSALVSEMIPNFNIIKKKNYAKFKHWDGIIKYYNPNNGMLFKGLYSKLIRFCKENHIQVNDLQTDTDGVFDLNYFKKLKINDYNEKEQHYYSIEPDKYQMEALEKSLVAKNLRIQVATGGGKTLYSYLLIHYLKTIVKGKIVIVVPRQDLANQVHTKYGYYSHFDDNFNMEDVSIVHSKSKHSPNNKIIFITIKTSISEKKSCS